MEAALVRWSRAGQRLLQPLPRLVPASSSSAAASTAAAAMEGGGRPADDVVLLAPVPESKYAAVLDHVTPIFLRDEPLSRCFPPCASGARAADFRAYAAEQLRSGLCVVALDGGADGAVVGACLSRVLPRDKVLGVDVASLGAEDDDPLIKNILRLLTTVHQRLDLFTALGVDELLEVGLMSVEASHTGRGLGARMMRASLRLGALRGLRAAKADATGAASAKSCGRAGLREVHALRYDEWRPGGAVAFAGTRAPDDALRVYAGRLQPCEPFALPPDGLQPLL